MNDQHQLAVSGSRAAGFLGAPVQSYLLIPDPLVKRIKDSKNEIRLNKIAKLSNGENWRLNYYNGKVPSGYRDITHPADTEVNITVAASTIPVYCMPILPVTLAFDIVTFPVQIIYLMSSYMEGVH